jgi:hypothetical protein
VFLLSERKSVAVCRELVNSTRCTIFQGMAVRRTAMSDRSAPYTLMPRRKSGRAAGVIPFGSASSGSFCITSASCESLRVAAVATGGYHSIPSCSPGIGCQKAMRAAHRIDIPLHRLYVKRQCASEECRSISPPYHWPYAIIVPDARASENVGNQ